MLREKFRWQNLNDSKDGSVGLPIYGRCWFKLNDETTLEIEWNLKTHFCHAYINFGGENVITTSVGFPPIALWFSIENYKLLDSLNKRFNNFFDGRKLGLHFFDYYLNWQLFVKNHYWCSSTPKWRDGSINILDLLFGKVKYEEKVLSNKVVTIPLLEKNYKAKLKMFVSYWKRPRWFTKKLSRASIDMIEPIPIPGKGSCSYNCDDDKCYGITVPAKTPEQAVGKLVEDILKTRSKRGSNWEWK